MAGHTPVLPLVGGEYYTFKNRGSKRFFDGEQYVNHVDEDSEAASETVRSVVTQLAHQHRDLAELLRERVGNYAAGLPGLDAWLCHGLA